MSTADKSSKAIIDRLRGAYAFVSNRIVYLLAAAAVAFTLWWIVAEAATPDGVDVRWNWSTLQWIGFVMVLACPALLAVLAAPKLRRWSSTHIKPDGTNLSLKWLVAIGLIVTLVLAALLFYWQAELLTAPGESAWSLESSELLDVSRSTAFGLGAIGAIAALLVGYRRQKSTEDAHQHEVTTTAANLDLERKKQKAEQISNLHDRYAKAVEQLASDNPTIRLGGVYVLSALANDWLAVQDYRQQQVCVDMLCAYLRNIPEVRASVTEGNRDKQFLILLKKDQDVRKAALESLSEIRTLETEGRDKSPAGLAQAMQDLYRTLARSGPIPKARIDLRGITLRGLDLRHARLAYLPLARVDLRNANLEDADLTKTNLSQAKMDGVVLRNATLDRTDLSGATLEDANLTNAVIINPRLFAATITTEQQTGFGNLYGATLIGVKVTDAVKFVAHGFNVVMDPETRQSASLFMSAKSKDLEFRPLDKNATAKFDRLLRTKHLSVKVTSGELTVTTGVRINFSIEDSENSTEQSV
ncbi:pentapeptide repeat-containing protein [Rhodococcus opacus]|uniref:pentapeptide repeat-containing protein n=1 Tax=Rhodococcus opacus TaxID=37919 RepID=UPI0007CD99EE|nr:pentapeptide repeat-containing protein [Rhodococcus opacus]MDX5962229.1 pentapeptide repeat-containing protein [Rhodococcus opacus]NKY74874.1 pentapeptide repeat-containing protein [Rhodococcus opacus]CAG7642214.1 hypothetical protein E143388_08369 [Rhodococcus opacus]